MIYCKNAQWCVTCGKQVVGAIMKSIIFLLTSLAALTIPVAGNAAVIINTSQVGGDVIFSFEGSLDLTGMTPTNSGNSLTAVAPSAGSILFSGPRIGMDVYSIASFPSFGSGIFVSGTATGDNLKIFVGDAVGFAAGYAGEVISGSLTVNGSFASLGLISGTYETAALSGDKIILRIPDLSQVPLPASLPLFASAFGLAFAFRRKRP